MDDGENRRAKVPWNPFQHGTKCRDATGRTAYHDDAFHVINLHLNFSFKNGYSSSSVYPYRISTDGKYPISKRGDLHIVSCHKAMKEEEFKARLKTLKKELARNEELMQEAAISYEDLVAEKESLLSTMENLRKSRAAEIRQGELSPR